MITWSSKFCKVPLPQQKNRVLLLWCCGHRPRWPQRRAFCGCFGGHSVDGRNPATHIKPVNNGIFSNMNWWVYRISAINKHGHLEQFSSQSEARRPGLLALIWWVLTSLNHHDFPNFRLKFPYASRYVLRFRDFPYNPMTCWWDWNPQSYSREVFGFLGFVPLLMHSIDIWWSRLINQLSNQLKWDFSRGSVTFETHPIYLPRTQMTHTFADLKNEKVKPLKLGDLGCARYMMVSV